MRPGMAPPARRGREPKELSLRLRALADTLEDNVEDYLREHPEASANDVYDHFGGKRQELLKVVARVRETHARGGSQIGNHLGTTSEQVPVRLVPESGTTQEPPFSEEELERVLRDLPEWRDAPAQELRTFARNLKAAGYFGATP